MRRIIKVLVILGILLSAGSAFAQEQTGSITVHLQTGKGSVTLYQTDGFTETDPQVLWRLVKEEKIQGIGKPITHGTSVIFDDLPQGEYLVTHEDGAFLPFTVSIPTTVNGTESFSVVARPKTQTSQTPQTADTADPWLLLIVFIFAGIGLIFVAAGRKKGKMPSV